MTLSYKRDFKRFYMATGVCIVAAILLTTVAIIGIPSGIQPIAFAAALLLIAGLFFILWPAIRQQEFNVIETLPGALEEVRKLGREYYRNTTAIQDNSAAVRQLNEDLDHKVNELLLLRKPLEEMLIQQRQENMTLRAELQDWQKTVVQHFEYLDRSSNLDDMDDLKRETYLKTARDFARDLRPLGFEVIEPKPGEPFNESLHEWKGEKDSELPAEQIVSVDGSGFRIGNRCIKLAPVFVSRRSAKVSEPAVMFVKNLDEKRQEVVLP